jgi:hypothetical protein
MKSRFIAKVNQFISTHCDHRPRCVHHTIPNSRLVTIVILTVTKRHWNTLHPKGTGIMKLGAAYDLLPRFGARVARPKLRASGSPEHSAGAGFARVAITMALVCVPSSRASAQAGFTQSSPKWSTTNFLGTDAGIRAQNCFNFLANVNANGLNFGGTCTLEYETSIDMSVNPFAGASQLHFDASPLSI